MMSDRIPRIAMLVWHLTRFNLDRGGGLERVVLTDAEYLSRRGVQVTISSREFQGDSDGFRTQQLKPLKFLGRHASTSYYGLFVLRNSSATVYHAFNSPLVAALAPHKTLVHFQNEVRLPGYGRFYQRYRKAHYACCSEYIRSWLINTHPHLDEKKVHVLHNGVDVNQFHPRNKTNRTYHPLRLLFVGQWNERKGLFLLLEAMERLRKRAQQIELLIAGSAGLWQSQSDQAQAAVIETKVKAWAARLPNVRLIGPCNYEEIPRIYRSADVMIVPSIWNEPFGLTALEAMATGLPVIAFNVGGLPEIIVDYETGYLVQQQTPEALAAAIAALLHQPDMIRNMGIAARARAEQYFSWGAHFRKLWELYNLVNPSLSRYSLPDKMRA